MILLCRRMRASSSKRDWLPACLPACHTLAAAEAAAWWYSLACWEPKRERERNNPINLAIKKILLQTCDKAQLHKLRIEFWPASFHHSTSDCTFFTKHVSIIRERLKGIKILTNAFELINCAAFVMAAFLNWTKKSKVSRNNHNFNHWGQWIIRSS